MAGPNGLEDCTWDSASSAFFRLGSTKIALTKFLPPAAETKTEKVRRAGGMLADKRTPGVVDIADTSIELLATDYEALVLPRLPRHGGTLVEFVITANVYHPSVLGSFAILCDRARIAKVEGPDFDATEKGLVMKLGVSVMNTWHKGRDGEWKCMALVPTLPSSQAVPLLKF